MPADQLSLFEPTGPEVIALAQSHERAAKRLQALADVLSLRGWDAAAATLLRSAADAESNAATLYMLAEFEALGGVQ